VFPPVCPVPRDPKGRLLQSRPFVFTGRISYGVYMWHPLAFTAGRRVSERAGIGSAATMLVCVGLAYAVASLSWFGFERYFLRLKDAAKLSRQRADLELAVARGSS
jgi:peptidoglycan/LPS O-acetylase OafA/YrhL